MTTTSCEKLFDVIPPDVRITDPTEGSNLKVGKTTAIKIDASDNSQISEVEIYVDNKLLSSLESSPYTSEWKPTSVGKYTIEAKAYDGGGNWNADEIDITVVVNLPPEITSFTADPNSGKVPLSVNFTCNASDPDGEILEYTWNFGDGLKDTTTTGSVIHDYELVGSYSCIITVIDDAASSDTQSVNISVVANQSPTIMSFTADPDSGKPPLTVNFSCNASDPDGNIIGYEWDFGDGETENTSSGSVTHTYQDFGNYTAEVVVIDDNDASGTAQVDITVANLPPRITSFTADPNSGEAPLQVHFVCNASDPDGQIVSYYWDFGDGDAQTTYVGDVSHTYLNSGNYVATVNVTDNDGETDASQFDIVAWGPGMKKWEFLTSDYITSSPAIGADGTIYVGSHDNKLYAINPDGTKKWEFVTGDWVSGSPAISSDGTIYVGSADGHLYAINSDGTQKWQFSAGVTNPAIGDDGTIYIEYYQSLYAINQNGTQKWEFEIASTLTSSPSIGSEGTIYVGSWDNKLYAINSDGIKEWEFLTGDDIRWSSPSIGNDGTIYVGSFDGKLYAISPDGTEKWAFDGGGYVYESPILGDDGTIYISFSGYYKLYAINQNGIQMWYFVTGGNVSSSAAIGEDGTIYVVCEDGFLYAINPNGTEKWKFAAGGSLSSSPAIGSDGTIYVGSSDGRLYAIYGESGGLANSSWPKFRHDNRNTGNVKP